MHGRARPPVPGCLESDRHRPLASDEHGKGAGRIRSRSENSSPPLKAPASRRLVTSDWGEWTEEQVSAIRQADRWRILEGLDGPGPRFGSDRSHGAGLVSFASNDYLGLAAHPAVVGAAREALDRFGAGATSSRLIAGDRTVHHALEDRLAAWRGTEAALVFPTGYQTNVAVLTTFGSGARIVSDELNHASIIDGARLSRADVQVYRHGDLEQAGRLVAEAPGRVLVVTDSVFSMDGDVAPLGGLSEICARHGALLVVDDAHAVFPLPDVDPEALVMRVGTLSKALGSQGGFVAGPRRWMELLVNLGRSFIFTTGLAPASTAAAMAAVEVIDSAEGAGRLDRLRRHTDAIRPGHPSPIVAVVLGEEGAALAAAAALRRQGLRVPAIRPPTVSPGASRLRVSLSAAHDESDVARLGRALAGLVSVQ
ncbi:MAG: 8-amino-7-oxononanoate synthase [Actinomycetota bacterium]|nr:8-amino-7-oxononanoate synthase [Actinomycetota bacterium]